MIRLNPSTSRGERRHRRRLASAGAILALAFLAGVGRTSAPAPIESSELSSNLGLPIVPGARLLARSFDVATGETLLVVDLSGETPTSWRDVRVVWRRPSLPGVVVAQPAGPMVLPSIRDSDEAWRRLVVDCRVRVELRDANSIWSE